MNKKALLLILDGWGLGENTEHNAIFQAKPPFWSKIYNDFPHATINCKEDAVGLPCGCLSGSEVGHVTLGAGRIVWQSVAKIDRSIQDGSWYENEVLNQAEKHLLEEKGSVHLVGLLSNGGIHSQVDHIVALVDWAMKKNIKKVALHLFLDGRDMPPTSALGLLKDKIFPLLNSNVQIATICGRATAMDRGEKWERTTTAFNLLTKNTEHEKCDIEKFLLQNYNEKIGDEFVGPARFNDWIIEKNDAVIFFNFRADRMRQLTRLFTGRAPHAEQQEIVVPENLYLASLTEYDSEFREVWVMYPPEYPANTLGEWASKKGVKQLRIAETEKYAHVTYFFNGGREEVFENEDRLVVPSLGLTNYASNPEMSLPEVTTSLVRAIEKESFGLIVCNIANGDMVGHSGDLQAGVKAVLAVDDALQKTIPAAQEHGYTVLITADHGNIEQMWHAGEPQTAHTFNEVPLVVLDKDIQLQEKGGLYQIAPTILKIMDIEKPEEMTGEAMF